MLVVLREPVPHKRSRGQKKPIVGGLILQTVLLFWCNTALVVKNTGDYTPDQKPAVPAVEHIGTPFAGTAVSHASPAALKSLRNTYPV